jgi:hypothetical protein
VLEEQKKMDEAFDRLQGNGKTFAKRGKSPSDYEKILTFYSGTIFL